MSHDYYDEKEASLWFVHVKTALILLLQIFSLLVLVLTTFHGIFWVQEWYLANGHKMLWELGLLRVWSGVNCDSYGMPVFNKVCNVVFKNAYGSLDEVANLICKLKYSQFGSLTPEAERAIKQFSSSSCTPVWSLFKISVGICIAWIMSGIAICTSFCCLFVFARKRYAGRLRYLYVISLGLQLCVVIVLIVTLTLYATKLNRIITSIWDNMERDDNGNVLIRKDEIGGRLGPAFYFTFIVIALSLFTAVLEFVWTPLVARNHRLIGRRPDPSSTKQAFWAYVPKYLQPDVYIAEQDPVIDPSSIHNNEVYDPLYPLHKPPPHQDLYTQYTNVVESKRIRAEDEKELYQRTREAEGNFDSNRLFLG